MDERQSMGRKKESKIKCGKVASKVGYRELILISLASESLRFWVFLCGEFLCWRSDVNFAWNPWKFGTGDRV